MARACLSLELSPCLHFLLLSIDPDRFFSCPRQFERRNVGSEMEPRCVPGTILSDPMSAPCHFAALSRESCTSKSALVKEYPSRRTTPLRACILTHLSLPTLGRSGAVKFAESLPHPFWSSSRGFQKPFGDAPASPSLRHASCHASVRPRV